MFSFAVVVVGMVLIISAVTAMCVIADLYGRLVNGPKVEIKEGAE